MSVVKLVCPQLCVYEPAILEYNNISYRYIFDINFSDPTLGWSAAHWRSSVRFGVLGG